MAAVLLNRRRSETAGGVENSLLAAWVVIFSILPIFAIRHPEFVGPAEFAVAILLLPTVIVAGLILAWRVFGREEIVADGDVLRVIRHLGPFRQTVAVPWSDIDGVSVAAVGRRETQNNVFGIGHPAVLVECRGTRIRCGLALGPGESADVAGQIGNLVNERRRRTRG